MEPWKVLLALSRGVFSYLRYGQLTDSCHYGPEWELLLSSKTGYSEIIFSILIILEASRRLVFMSSPPCQVFGIAWGWFFIRSALDGPVELSASIDACVSPYLYICEDESDTQCPKVSWTWVEVPSLGLGSHTSRVNWRLSLSLPLWSSMFRRPEQAFFPQWGQVPWHREYSLLSLCLCQIDWYPLCQNQLYVQAQSQHGEGLPRVWPWQTESLGSFL